MKKVDIKQISMQWIYTFDFLTGFSNKISNAPNVTIKQFYDEWSNKCGFQNNKSIYPLQNTLGFYLSGMYILIACYKEAEYGKLPRWKLSEINKEEWGNFVIETCEKENPDFQYFIRRIRNSLNHYRFELKEEGDENILIFRDGKNKKIIDFEVKFNINDLHKFIFKFARSFIIDGF